MLTPLLDRRFRRYLTIFFVFAFANLFIPAFSLRFSRRDMGLGYGGDAPAAHTSQPDCLLFGGRLTSGSTDLDLALLYRRELPVGN